MAEETKINPTNIPYFVRHGAFCVSHPMEVIAATITTSVVLFSYIMSIAQRYNFLLSTTNDGRLFTLMSANQDMHRALLTFVRCVSLLYCYYQLRMVQRLHYSSKSIAGLTGLFAFLSALLFSSVLINILQVQVTELGDLILFYLLCMDMSKASRMIRVGVCASNQFQVNTGIANTMGQLAPSFTLDSIIQILVISIGLISGVRQMEILSALALLAVMTNYIIFLTVFPAMLSMIREVSRGNSLNPKYQSSSTLPVGIVSVSTVNNTNACSEQQKAAGGKLATQWSQQFRMSNYYSYTFPAPLLKLVIGGSFLLLQSYGYWNFPGAASTRSDSTSSPSAAVEILEEKMPSTTHNGTEDSSSESLDTYNLIISYLFLRFDQIVFSALLLVLAVKYIFYDDKHQSSAQTSSSSMVGIEDISVYSPAKDTPIQRVLPVVSSKKSSHHHQQQQQNSSSNHQSSSSSSSSPPTRSNSLAITDEECFEGEGEEFKNNKNSNMAVAASSNNNMSTASFRKISFTLGESESDSDFEGMRKISDDLVSSTAFLPIQDTKEVQTLDSCLKEEMEKRNENLEKRSLEECIKIYDSIEEGAKCLTDAEVMALVHAKKIPAYQLEKAVQDEERGVKIRRKLMYSNDSALAAAFDEIPFQHYDYSKITGACCENVVGYVPVPVGIVGPLKLNGNIYQVPMATTEGCLVASTNRGCRALVNGVMCKVVADGMSRGPVVRFPSAMKSSYAAIWLNEPENYKKIKDSFDGSSRFARLRDLSARPTGRYLFLRLVARTGDAMGMNMISKGTEVALNTLQKYFPDMEILSLSGNYCTDKKPAAINWTEGRGKSVVAEAVVPAKIVKEILKTTASALVELNIAKNLVGSAVAGSIGGFNAHAANIVAAIYIATGQDAAQCVGSSNCMTLMETWGSDHEDLYISCTMPSIEVGTVGGGTVLPAQSSCLNILGVQGPHLEDPGQNAKQLASIVCATVLAGELSLMSALAAGHLVRSHLKHNRSSAQVDTSMRSVATAPANFTSSPNMMPPLGRNNNNNTNNNYNLRNNNSNSNHCSNNVNSNNNTSISSPSSKIHKGSKPGILTIGNSNKANSNNKDSPSKTATSELHPVTTTTTSHSIPHSPLIPLTTMDFLSVPTECKQF